MTTTDTTSIIQSRVYLASPYSHEMASRRGQRYWQACLAAAWLKQKCFHVYSPIAHSHGIAKIGDFNTDYQTWQHECEDELLISGVFVALLIDGWRDSKGMKAEWKIARRLGLVIRGLKTVGYDAGGYEWVGFEGWVIAPDT